MSLSRLFAFRQRENDYQGRQPKGGASASGILAAEDGSKRTASQLFRSNSREDLGIKGEEENFDQGNSEIETVHHSVKSDPQEKKAAGRRACIKTAVKVAIFVAVALAIAGTLLGLHYGGVIPMDQLFNHTFKTWESILIFGGGGVAAVAALYLGNKLIDRMMRKGDDVILYQEGQTHNAHSGQPPYGEES